MISEKLLWEAGKQVANLAKVIIGLANDPGISATLKKDIEDEMSSIRDYIKNAEKNEMDRIEAIRQRLKDSK